MRNLYFTITFTTLLNAHNGMETIFAFAKTVPHLMIEIKRER